MEIISFSNATKFQSPFCRPQNGRAQAFEPEIREFLPRYKRLVSQITRDTRQISADPFLGMFKVRKRIARHPKWYTNVYHTYIDLPSGYLT